MELIGVQDEQIKDLKDSRDAWYNNHWLLMGVGAIAGGFVVYKIRR